MGLACPMLPHGQHTTTRGIVSLIFTFLCPGFMVIPTVTALAITARCLPCPMSTGMVDLRRQSR